MNLYNTTKRMFGRWGFFFFVWAVYFILRRRSFETRLRVTRFIAFLVYHFLWKGGRERIKRNISLIHPRLNERQVNQAGWKTAKTIARSWAAMIGNEFTSLEEIREKLEIIGIEKLLDYYREGRKIIATAVHVGPVDEMIGIIPILGLRAYIPTEAVNPEWYFNFMMRLRLRFGDIIFEKAEKGKILDRASYHLSDGRIVVLLVDALREDRSGICCRIGMAEAKFPVGAIKLALEQDATIFPVFPSLRKDGKVQVAVGLPFKLIKTGNVNQDIESNTRRLIEEVFAPHIRKNYSGWLRLLRSNLRPAGSSLNEY